MSIANGARLRTLRRRMRLTQEDAARRAGISHRTVQRIEAGAWDQVRHGALRRLSDALGAQIRVVISWNGAQLDRLVDAGHAELQNAFAGLLTAAGWSTAIEASFNHYGDRGRYDILAWHAATRIALVVEVKTAVGDVQATLGSLDVKVRLATTLAEREGWGRPLAVVPALVIADERHQRRLVAQHGALFARFPLRGRSARAWLRHPAVGPNGLLLYLPITNARMVSIRRVNRAGRGREGAGGMT